MENSIKMDDLGVPLFSETPTTTIENHGTTSHNLTSRNNAMADGKTKMPKVIGISGPTRAGKTTLFLGTGHIEPFQAENSTITAN